MTQSLTTPTPEGQISKASRRRKGEDVDSTPLGDSLRLLAANCLSSGQDERAAGIMIAADVVEGHLRGLSGGSLVKALDRMIETRLRSFAEEVVADVLAGLRDEVPNRAARPADPLPPSPAPEHPFFAHFENEPTAAVPKKTPRARETLAPAASGPRVVASAHLQAMGKGVVETLVAVAQHEASGPISRAHLTTITGHKRSTRNRYLSTLTGARFVTEDARGLVVTADGKAALGESYEKLPTGDKLREHALRTLPKGEGEILAHLASFYPHVVSGEQLGAALVMARSTRNRYLSTLKARGYVEQTGPTHYQAAPLLFGPSKRPRKT